MSSNTELKVSVVMPVFDKPCDVQRSIDSVLLQQGVDFEFLIVDDGSSADVKALLAEQTDPRIRVIEQENQGITLALINGCAEAAHPFIARLDAGDQMRPKRLQKQAQLLRTRHDVALVSCWVHMHTDEGYPLYDVKLNKDELREGLLTTQSKALISPVHASVMFRTDVYLQVGGYRSEFYFTQDCDLWARMLQRHQVYVIDEILLDAIFSASGLSGRYANYQRQLADLIVESNRLHELGKPDVGILNRAKLLRPSVDSQGQACGEFDGNYFIASSLMRSSPKHAYRYWLKALAEKPWHLKALARFVISLKGVVSF